jgi:hypothetical protein
LEKQKKIIGRKKKQTLFFCPSHGREILKKKKTPFFHFYSIFWPGGQAIRKRKPLRKTLLD